MSTPRRRSVSTSFLFPVSPARASTISPDLNRINHLPLSGRLDKGFGVTFKSPARASPPTILSRTWSSLKTKDVFERLAAPTLSRRKTRKLFHHTIVTILIVYGCTLLVGFLFPKSFLAELRPSPSMLPNLARPPSHEIVQYPTRALLLVEELETVVLPVKEVKEREKEMVARKATMERFRREILWKEASAPPLQVTVVREKREYSHEATVIFLHGMKQDAASSPLHGALANRFPSIRWVMPQAPSMPITVVKNEIFPSWFDIKTFPHRMTTEDEQGLYLSTQLINAVIRTERTELLRRAHNRNETGDVMAPAQFSYTVEREHEADKMRETKEERAFASARIFLVGFSQGGILSLMTGLTSEHALAGIGVISGFLPLHKKIFAMSPDMDRATPIFFGHGKEDDIILHSDAAFSAQRLTSSTKAHVEFHSYPRLGHGCLPLTLDQLGDWMETVLPTENEMFSSIHHRKQGAGAGKSRGHRNKRMMMK